MTPYYCQGCNQIIYRDCNDSKIESYCVNKNKTITITKISAKVQELYFLIKKYFKQP